jgi:hypothetical protein
VKTKKLFAQFSLLVAAACTPTSTGTPAPVLEPTQGPVQASTALPPLSDSQSYELTATLLDSARKTYPVTLAPEMGCWPGNMTATLVAWRHVSQSKLYTGEDGVPGYNGAVILFAIDNAFAGAAQLDFSLGDPARTYFTTLP